MTEGDQTAVWVKKKASILCLHSLPLCVTHCFVVKADSFFPPQDAYTLMYSFNLNFYAAE